uniref:GEM-interacting protein isoform X2 n=1 Tax=Pristiophorus japonicus TaxID=55135 RepID=UPI00398F16BF
MDGSLVKTPVADQPPSGAWEPRGHSPGPGTSQLTEAVRDFAHALGQFKDVLPIQADAPVDQERMLERLTAMLLALDLIIGRYPSLNPNNSLVEAAAAVANMVHGLSAQGEGNEKPRRYSEIFQGLDALEISFGNSTVDLFMTETDDSFISPDPSPEEEILVNEDFFSECPDHGIEERDDFQVSVEEGDGMLLKCEGGVESALQYAKFWAKYAKDLLSWMERRNSAEIEFSKNIIKMAETGKNLINQEKFMPFQYVYTMALQHDIHHGQETIKTRILLQHNKYIQPLMSRKNELEKRRRDFKEQWQREQRKMHDALTALRKSKQMYLQRCEDFEKAKLHSAKAEEEQQSLSVSGSAPGSASKQLEKRRRSKDEAHVKVQEAETYYKTCVSEANIKRQEMERMKMRIITQLCKLIHQCDLTLKAVSVNLFQMQQEQIEPVSFAFQSMHENIKPYEPGKKYFEFIQNLDKKMLSVESYEFEEFATPSRRSSPTGRRKSGVLLTHRTSASSGDFPNVADEVENKLRTKSGLSDSESCESRSFDSPTSSPAHFDRKFPKATPSRMSPDDSEDRDGNQLQENDLTDLINESSGTQGRFKNVSLSKAAQTHRLRKLRSPTKCRECDGLIMVNGAECEECYLACHRKCLETVAILCGHRKLQNKVSLFGVDFAQVPRETAEEVPFIIRHCTSEIESRALNVQLPEPIVLFSLYNDFMNFAKELQQACEEQKDNQARGMPAATDKVAELVQQAKILLQNLPASNYNTLEHIIGHLHRVAEQYEENKMSSNNLGIIFSPTLIRPPVQEDTISMISLVNSGYQAQVVDFFIMQHSQIFKTGQGLKPWPHLPENSPLEMMVNRVGEALSSAKGRSKSSESLALKRHSSEGYVSDKSSSNEALDDAREQRRASSGSSDMAAAGLAVVVAVAVDDWRPADGHNCECGDGAEPSPRGPFNRQLGKYQRYGQAKTRPILPKPSALPIITANMPSAAEEAAAAECPEIPAAATADGEAAERRAWTKTPGSSRSSSPDSGGGGTLRRTAGKHKRFEMTVGTARLVSKLQDRRRLESSEGAAGVSEGERPGGLETERARPGAGVERRESLETERHAAAHVNANQSNNVWSERVLGQREERRDVERMLHVLRHQSSLGDRQAHFV